MDPKCRTETETGTPHPLQLLAPHQPWAGEGATAQAGSPPALRGAQQGVPVKGPPGNGGWAPPTPGKEEGKFLNCFRLPSSPGAWFPTFRGCRPDLAGGGSHLGLSGPASVSPSGSKPYTVTSGAWGQGWGRGRHLGKRKQWTKGSPEDEGGLGRPELCRRPAPKSPGLPSPARAI